MTAISASIRSTGHGMLPDRAARRQAGLVAAALLLAHLAALTAAALAF